MVVREFINIIGFKINQSQLKNAERKVESVTKRLDRFGARMSVAFTAPFALFAKNLASTLSDFEQLDVAFTTMLGSAGKAKMLLDDVFALAVKTPFTIMEAAKAARQLLAVGTPAESVIDHMKMLGDVAAGLSIPLERVVYNFGQVRARGYLTGQELKDFARAGIPMVAELSKLLGVTSKQILDMVSNRQISFENVIEVFQKMTSEGGRFHDLMIKQSKTLGGLWSNFVDRVLLSAKLVEKQLLPPFKKFVMFLSRLLDMFNKIDPRIKAFVFWVGALIATVGPLSLVLSVLIKAFSVLAIKIAALAAPILGVIALLGLLVEDVVGYVNGARSALGMLLPP